MTETKIALVTGGNRGLGLATCEALVASGYRVLMACRTIEAGQQAATGIGSGLIEVVQLDVASATDIERLTQLIETKYGRLDVLINNAGVLLDAELGQPASICDATPEVIRQTLEINTVAPIAIINAMLPLMNLVDDARIVNISSGMGQMSGMGSQYAGYRISKAALNAMTLIYSLELDPQKFKINAVSPGWVRTDMGTKGADLSVEEGVDTAVWLATSDDAQHSGGFFRQRKLIDW
jgi:NAD(P)-dependent dehydrogenase (short-subunit alcohol dehydrogenase family)